eukprot:s119_g88.t1
MYWAKSSREQPQLAQGVPVDPVLAGQHTGRFETWSSAAFVGTDTWLGGVSGAYRVTYRSVMLESLDWALNSPPFIVICQLGRHSARFDKICLASWSIAAPASRDVNCSDWESAGRERVVVSSASLTEYATRSYMSLEGFREQRPHEAPMMSGQDVRTGCHSDVILLSLQSTGIAIGDLEAFLSKVHDIRHDEGLCATAQQLHDAGHPKFAQDKRQRQREQRRDREEEFNFKGFLRSS